MAWLYLLFAGLLEIVWATAMKLSDVFSRPGASVVTLVASTGSFVLLGLAMRTLPLGTAYTVWTGIGAIGAFIVDPSSQELGPPAIPGWFTLLQS